MAQGRSTKIIWMIWWIRTSRLSIKKSLSSHLSPCLDVPDEPQYGSFHMTRIVRPAQDVLSVRRELHPGQAIAIVVETSQDGAVVARVREAFLVLEAFPVLVDRADAGEFAVVLAQVEQLPRETETERERERVCVCV